MAHGIMNMNMNIAGVFGNTRKHARCIHARAPPSDRTSEAVER